MNRRWFRWIALLLTLEGCLYLFGISRYFTDYRGSVNRSRPLLLIDSYTIAIYLDSGETREFSTNDDLTRKLEDFVETQSAWQLHRARHDYNPARDILVSWDDGKPHIRYKEKTSQVRTWGPCSLLQVMPDGTIWVGEKGHFGGIAVVDTEGRFLGWRAKGFAFGHYHAAAEADETVMPLVEKLLARPQM